MSDVRFQSKSAPRATGIARTSIKNTRPAGSGANVSSSAGAAPGGRQMAALHGNPNARPPTTAAPTVVPSTKRPGLTLTDAHLGYLETLINARGTELQAAHAAALQATPPDEAHIMAIVGELKEAGDLFKIVGAELAARGK